MRPVFLNRMKRTGTIQPWNEKGRERASPANDDIFRYGWNPFENYRQFCGLSVFSLKGICIFVHNTRYETDMGPGARRRTARRGSAMIKKVVFATVLAASLALAGCLGSGSSSRNSTNSADASRALYPDGGQSAPRAVQSGGGANLFRLPMTDGQTVMVRSPALLFFFTSWCGYCKTAMPEFKQLAARVRAQGWRVYGIDVGEGPAKANQIIQEHQPNFPVLLDQQSLVTRQYRLEGYPTFIMIDENANIIYNSHDLPRNF
jgi:thiol-disulfide isomerase/thioredoxin